MAKKSPFIQPGSADVGVAVLAGDAFYAHAQAFIKHAGSDLSEAGVRAASAMGEMTVSATSLTLSIEAYLKALLLQCGRSAPHTHHLPDLFSGLPAQVQKKVEDAYERLRSEESYGIAEFEIHITGRSAKSPPGFGQRGQSRNLALHALLQRNANAYVKWRYLFAQSPTADGAPLVYEFLRLSYAARAVREQFGQIALSIGP